MSAEQEKTFICDRCSQRFAWKDALIGRKIRCKCGNVFVAGETRPRERLDAYDIDPEPVNPKPLVASPASKVLAYQPKPQPSETASAASWSLKEMFVPAALLAVGIGVRGAQILMPSASGQSTAVSVGIIALGIALNVALTLAAIFVAANFLGVNFGPVSHAIVKVTAMSVLVGAVASVIANIDRGKGMQGPVIALHMVVILYWILFAMFFELDVQETVVTVVIVTAFQTAAFCVLIGKI